MVQEQRAKPKALIPVELIEKRTWEIACEIEAAYTNPLSALYIIGVLTGSFIFVSDLVRCLSIPLTITFIKASSYEGLESSGSVAISGIEGLDIEGRDVLLVEDIVDTGLTLTKVIERLAQYRPRTIKVCTLLDKPCKREYTVDVDYIGFEIPDKFVVGYGLDYKGIYRNLPYIGVMDGNV